MEQTIDVLVRDSRTVGSPESRPQTPVTGPRISTSVLQMYIASACSINYVSIIIIIIIFIFIDNKNWQNNNETNARPTSSM